MRKKKMKDSTLQTYVFDKWIVSRRSTIELLSSLALPSRAWHNPAPLVSFIKEVVILATAILKKKKKAL